MKPVVLKILFLFITTVVYGQKTQKYWIYFDHGTSLQTALDSIASQPGQINNVSTWLHAASIRTTKSQIQAFRSSVFVDSISPVLCLTTYSQAKHYERLGFALEQIGAEHFLKKGIEGAGVKIGIIDGGFLNADKHPSLTNFFKNGLVLDYRDYITPDMPNYHGNARMDDHHGTDVWEMIGGMHSEKGIRYGMATKASYMLARTDHGVSEKRIEEDYFVAALEWMHDNGVQLVNASIGYTNGYDNPNENYSPEQMNGSSAIARAVQIAADKKGMLIIVAAGNDGAKDKWKILGTPADAKGALTVGASKLTLLDRMRYSSLGPDFLPYLKPEVSCFSSAGTSFTAPVVTGLAACIWQYDSSLTNYEVKSIIEKSCALYPYGNNYVGYGVPSVQKIIKLLNNPSAKVEEPFTLSTSKKSVVVRLDGSRSMIIVYHKKNSWVVIKKDLIKPLRKKLRIKKLPRSEQTTIIQGDHIWEIFWSDF